MEEHVETCGGTCRNMWKLCQSCQSGASSKLLVAKCRWMRMSYVLKFTRSITHCWHWPNNQSTAPLCSSESCCPVVHQLSKRHSTSVLAWLTGSWGLHDLIWFYMILHGRSKAAIHPVSLSMCQLPPGLTMMCLLIYLFIYLRRGDESQG